MTFSPLDFVPLQRGARDTNPSGPVHRMQGWLELWGYPCDVDGDLGPQTEYVLTVFQDDWVKAPHRKCHLDEPTWAALTAPLAMAMDTLPVRTIAHTLRGKGSDLSIGAAVEIVARQWLAQSVGGGPLRELPGNSGPVVEACTRRLAEENRLPCFCGHVYGSHGVLTDACLNCPCVTYSPDWRLAWCAAWDSTVLRQACESLGVPMPIKGSLSCDELARQARESTAGASLLTVGGTVTGGMVRPGDLFLVRGERPGDWTHCGVVLHFQHLPRGKARIITAEGNTNANGSRNGDRLLERTRPITGLDFICWRKA